MVARTIQPWPRKEAIFLHLAGDSTTRRLTISARETDVKGDYTIQI